ncbi:LytTR family transcriptional regulator [Panacibacter sp. DH6]|uniref:LytTR family transcriptional regulator n=1 Tax=Panacibacter microcysteis TaxID=2793269 RepID=A0A931E0I9_9BACT|nr:LytTR family DNA-binding domain-containing protein [Panacibacter microcysteis]MBG9374853.1 LytTR family transcriptional regulator [Panacibacter microcysteis]
MIPPTLTNGFAQRKLTATGMANSSFTGEQGLQVFILSKHSDTVSVLLCGLRDIKFVNVCRVHDDLTGMMSMHTYNNAVLFVDATIMSEETVRQVKTAVPSILIVVLKQKDMVPGIFYKDVFSYLNSPVVFGDLFSVMSNALQYCSQRGKAMMRNRDFVLIKSEYRLLKIRLADILFVEGMKDYVKIWLKDKNAPVTTLQNLKEFEAKLPADNFIRVHKSYIVALQHIDCIARNEIVIGNHSIPVGDAFRNGLNGFILSHS